jgi:hypothetical protein
MHSTATVFVHYVHLVLNLLLISLHAHVPVTVNTLFNLLLLALNVLLTRMVINQIVSVIQVMSLPTEVVFQSKLANQMKSLI